MSPGRRKLRAQLAAMWAEEIQAASVYERMAERAPETRWQWLQRQGARDLLTAIAADRVKTAGWLLDIIIDFGRWPIPAPHCDVGLESDFVVAIRAAAARERKRAERYSDIACMARKSLDLNVPMPCEFQHFRALETASKLDDIASCLERHKEVAS